MTNQKLSKQNLPICPEVCPDCRTGNHCFHVIDELGDLSVRTETTRYSQFDRRTKTHYIIEGWSDSSPDNFWLKRILKLAAHSLEEIPPEAE